MHVALGRGPGLVGLPGGGRARGSLGEHLVDLLERETLGLGHEEVREEEGQHTERAPDEEDLRAEVGLVGGHHVGRDNADDAVPEPVGRGRDADTARADGQREELADDDPRGGAPGGRKERDEDADERDLGLDGAGVAAGRVDVVRGDADDGNDELRDDHARGTHEQDATTAVLLDDVERDGRREHVDERGDERDQEGVADRAERLEEGRAEVEDEVDTGELLHALETGAEKCTADVGRAIEQRALEAGEPRADVRGLGDMGLLVLVVGNDLGKLVLDEGGVTRLVANLGERNGGLLEITLLDPEARGLGEEEETRAEDDGPKELDADGDTVGAGVVAVLGRVDDAVGEQDADGDGELVAGDERAADLLGRNLRHVEDDDGRDEADTDTCDETTDDEEGQLVSTRDLEDATDAEDDTASDDSDAATEEVGKVTSNKRAKEVSRRQDRGHERLFPARKGKVGGQVCSIGREARILLAGVHPDEVGHTEDTTHPAGVVSEENAAEGSKDAHEVRLDGDRGLDPAGIGSTEHNSTSRHRGRMRDGGGGGGGGRVWGRLAVLSYLQYSTPMK